MSTLELLQHYFDYLRSPPVLLAILVITGPIALEIFKNKALANHPPISKVPSCFRLGLIKRGNLSDQHERQILQDHRESYTSETEKAHVKALFTYPVKACRGIELAASEVGALGLKYDRHFTFAQLVTTQDKSNPSSTTDDVTEVSGDWNHDWRFITQRECPRLALLETELWVPDPRASKKAGANAPGAKGGKAQKRGDDSPQSAPNQDSTQPSHDTSESSWATNGGCLVIHFPFEPDFNPFGLRTETIAIRIPLTPTVQRADKKEYTLEPLQIWKDSPQALNITAEIPAEDLANLKHFLGVSNPLGLFRVDPTNSRTVTRSLPKEKQDEIYSVGFADAFPLHILNLASVHALDDGLPTKDQVKGKLDARRFRANVYVTGPTAYAEDSWKRVNMGRCIQPKDGRSKGGGIVETEGEYHVACRTARCKVPNVDPATDVKDVNEPSSTLSRTRQVDEGAYPHPCLGMQMIPLFQQGIIRVGDEVKVLKQGEHYYEKMFS